MPLLLRVRDMDVPVIGVVTDKEKGLVPAVARVFPEVPYQFCHTHFLKNCAKPMQADLSALQVSVRRCAEAVREIAKLLHELTAAATAVDHVEPPTACPPPASSADEPHPTAGTPEQTTPATPSVVSEAGDPTNQEHADDHGAMSSPITEEGFVREVCDLVRANSLVSGKAPLDPAELGRHDRLEAVRALVHEAQKKKRRSRPTPAPGP